MEKKYTKEEWAKFLRGLAGRCRVFVPVRDGDFHTFKVMDQEKSPDFSYENGRLSPKSAVYPQSERMFEYTLDERQPECGVYRETPKDLSSQVVVGIRPCDAHALHIVRPNFDNPEYRDPWWVKRFESTTLIGLGCNNPSGTCFCSSVGGGPFSEKGLDILLYDLGETLAAKPVSEILPGEYRHKTCRRVDEPALKGSRCRGEGRNWMKCQGTSEGT